MGDELKGQGIFLPEMTSHLSGGEGEPRRQRVYWELGRCQDPRGEQDGEEEEEVSEWVDYSNFDPLIHSKSTGMKSLSSILSILVALKSMATGSGKVWGTKLSPKVQRKRVKSKVALLKVRKKLLAFPTMFCTGLSQWTGKPAGVWGILRVVADFWSLQRKEVRRGVWRWKPNCWQV